MSLLDTFQLVATRRRIWPNDGFCRHLLQFEKEKKQKKANAKLKPSAQIEKIQNELEQCIINDEKNDTETLAKNS